MTKIDTSTESVEALIKVHNSKIDGTVRGGFNHAAAGVLSSLLAEHNHIRAEMLEQAANNI